VNFQLTGIFMASLAYVSTGDVKDLAAKIIVIKIIEVIILNDADMREKMARASSHIAKNMIGKS